MVNKVYITVENGIIINIASTNPDMLNVTVVDWDTEAEERVRLYENYKVSPWSEEDLNEAIANVRQRLTNRFRKQLDEWVKG